MSSNRIPEESQDSGIQGTNNPFPSPLEPVAVWLQKVRDSFTPGTEQSGEEQVTFVEEVNPRRTLASAFSEGEEEKSSQEQQVSAAQTDQGELGRNMSGQGLAGSVSNANVSVTRDTVTVHNDVT